MARRGSDHLGRSVGGPLPCLAGGVGPDRGRDGVYGVAQRGARLCHKQRRRRSVS